MVQHKCKAWRFEHVRGSQQPVGFETGTAAAAAAAAGLFTKGPAAIGGVLLDSVYPPVAGTAGLLGTMALGLTPVHYMPLQI